MVPVVGGALSDALGSVQSCVKLLKTSVGAYGIIIAVMTFLPLLIESISWLLVTKISQVVAGFLGVEMCIRDSIRGKIAPISCAKPYQSKVM